MLLTEEEVNVRLESPLNLMNRLQKATEKPELNLFTPPSIEELVDNLEDKLHLGNSHSSALKVLDDSVRMLGQRLCEVDKAKDLSRIATDMSKVVNSIDEIRNGRNNIRQGQITIWQPVIMNETHYETIHVHE